MAKYPEVTTFKPDLLMAGGNMPTEYDGAIIAKGNKYKRGTMLGKITATGECVITDATAKDGSEQLFAILTEDVDTTEATVSANVLYTGNVNAGALIVKTGETPIQYKDQGRKIGLFIRKAQPVV